MAGSVAAFSGSHRYILDYLTEEVLERQPDEVRSFLVETSVLERLSGALCDPVTGHAGSQAMLEQVERAGLFLVLDEVRGWWRYHQLFADLLRAPPAGATARPGGRSCTVTRRPGVRSMGPGRAADRRELEILVLLAAGTPNSRIAAELVVSPDSVKKHVSHLLGKLGAANRTEAVTRAR